MGVGLEYSRELLRINKLEPGQVDNAIVIDKRTRAEPFSVAILELGQVFRLGTTPTAFSNKRDQLFISRVRLESTPRGDRLDLVLISSLSKNLIRAHDDILKGKESKSSLIDSTAKVKKLPQPRLRRAWHRHGGITSSIDDISELLK